jgi:hypothetical protein
MLPPTVPITFIENSGSTTASGNVLNVLGTGGIVTSGIGNTITIALSGVGPDIQTLKGNTGAAVGPDGSNNINTVGTGSITVVGVPGTHTLTAQLTGLTNNSVLYGLGTATIGLVPVVNNGVLITGTSGTPVITALNSDGQLIIGSTIGAPAAATITAGTGITITNGHNSITIAVNGSVVGETITGNSGGALSPTAGNWNIFGASTAAGTTPITTSGAVSTLTINVQKSQAIATTDATKVGLSNFLNTQFSVDANGFVSLVGGTGPTILTLTPNSGTSPVVPTAGGTISVLGTASTTTVGSLNTVTVQLTGLTQYNRWRHCCHIK